MASALTLREPKLPNILLNRRRRTRRWDAFGIDALVGPKGSGKSLLAHHRAHAYHQGLVRMPDGTCVCRRPNDCEYFEEGGRWPVFSNLKSTNIGEPAAEKFGGGWTRSLEIAVDVLGHETTHSLVVGDEGYQLMDSRRGMGRNALEVIDEVTQSRKASVATFITGLSVDWLDVRIRSQLRASYNCWTPNRGMNTYAVYTEHALGYLAPWDRKKMRPEVRRWFTAPSRNIYDTHERVMVREQLAAQKEAGKERGYLRKTPDGEVELVPISSLIMEAVAAMLGEPSFDGRVSPRLIMHYCEQRDAPVSADEVVDIMERQVGFLKERDGRYHVGMVSDMASAV